MILGRRFGEWVTFLEWNVDWWLWTVSIGLESWIVPPTVESRYYWEFEHARFCFREKGGKSSSSSMNYSQVAIILGWIFVLFEKCCVFFFFLSSFFIVVLIFLKFLYALFIIVFIFICQSSCSIFFFFVSSIRLIFSQDHFSRGRKTIVRFRELSLFFSPVDYRQG